MKKIFFIFVLSWLFSPALQAGDFIIHINGSSQEIGLDQEQSFTLPEGKVLKLKLSQKAYLEFQGDFFSFEHKNAYKANRTNLGEDIWQTALITPLGTSLMVQEYKNLDPSILVDLMLKEITQEEVKAGYTYSEKAISQAVGDLSMKGKEAVTTSSSGDKWIRRVLSYGKKGRGLLIVTSVEKANYEKEKFLIEDFWRTFKLK